MTHVLHLLVLHGSSAAASPLDATWARYLETPPPRAVVLADALSARADEVTSSLDPAALAVTGPVDVVCSGGGNLDAFYMGVAMVLARVEAGSGALEWHRSAGASAGGMMSFELALKGERLTLEHHLAYGVLTEDHPLHYALMPAAALTQDRHWRDMAAWQTGTYADSLSTLDGRVALATACLAPWPRLIKLDAFTAVDHQASAAFMATGTLFQEVEGLWCTDGGALSGPNMTPLFQDGARPQVVIDLMRTGSPSELVWSLRLSEWVALVERGQDAAAQFLQTGAVPGGRAITLCPAGSSTRGNVCRD